MTDKLDKFGYTDAERYGEIYWVLSLFEDLGEFTAVVEFYIDLCQTLEKEGLLKLDNTDGQRWTYIINED